jgi:hypothetical protein
MSIMTSTPSFTSVIIYSIFITLFGLLPFGCLSLTFRRLIVVFLCTQHGRCDRLLLLMVRVVSTDATTSVEGHPP